MPKSLSPLTYFGLLLCFGLSALAVSPATAFETAAREALLIDADTGTLLLDKGADTSMPPASMSKIMTVYMVFEALKDGRLTQVDEDEIRAFSQEMATKLWKEMERTRV